MTIIIKMKKLTVRQLIEFETKLLEIYENHRFELSFGDFIKLGKLMKEIGEITNLFFELQKDFYNEFQDKNKLELYHEKLQYDEIEYDTTEIEEFLKKTNLK